MDVDAGPASPPGTFPYYLQFWTRSAHLRLGGYTIDSDSDIRRCTILDRNDDICESIVLPDKFANSVQDVLNTKAFEFIATSDANILRRTRCLSGRIASRRNDMTAPGICGMSC